MGTDHIEPGTLRSRVAVVLICHGTVERVEDIPAFIRNIHGGRPGQPPAEPPAEVIHEVQSRFERIGGSPLMRLTHAQAAALEARLGVTVRAAARLWHPYPDEVLAALVAEVPTIEAVVCVPLAPQSVHVYNAVVRVAAEARGLRFVGAPSWGTEPKLVSAFADAIAEARGGMAADAAVLLTAHSLPQRVVDAGDPYERDFRQMAGAVAQSLLARGVAPEAWIQVAFQSQGMGGGAWLGPDLRSAFEALRGAGADRLLIAPIGFLAEHVETLYDIDIEAVALAEQLGFVEVARMPPMNTREAFVDALAAVVSPLLAAATGAAGAKE